MVNRLDTNIVRKLDELSEKETLAVVEYISQLLSQRISKQSETQTNDDDLIAFLAEKRENARARQVIEWERVRRRNFPKAA